MLLGEGEAFGTAPVPEEGEVLGTLSVPEEGEVLGTLSVPEEGELIPPSSMGEALSSEAGLHPLEQAIKIE